MKPWSQRCLLASLPWIILAGGLAVRSSRAAELSALGQTSFESVSGQFIISSPAASATYETPLPDNVTITGVHLEPALLAVTAERIKQSVWRTLGVPAGAQWQGNIFLVLHPARQWDEPAPISSLPGARGWNYRVNLPDALPKYRFVRTIASAVLFELAEHNVSASPRAPELPAWLVDGLTQNLITEEFQDPVVAPPGKLLNGLPQSRQVSTKRGLESLTTARQTLRQFPPLTFAQMSWPTADQLNGNDGDAYLASAQVFVSELLDLPDGPARLDSFLSRLPRCENWQTAFQETYQPLFPKPLDVEKWWSLRLINFSAHDPGPAWTPEVSRWKLNEILQVPVEIRSSSNSLPAHAELSLQEAIRKVSYAQQDAVFTGKIGELGMAQLRLVPSLAGLAQRYRQVLAAYLGQKGDIPVAYAGRSVREKAGARETLKKLDQLDAQRQLVEANIKPDVLNTLRN